MVFERDKYQQQMSTLQAKYDALEAELKDRLEDLNEADAKFDSLRELVQEAVDANRDRLDFCKLRKVATFLEAGK